jgi:hypothetical protein
MPSPLTLTPAASSADGTYQRFTIPDGWVARGVRFDIQPITSEQPGRIAQSLRRRRFASNSRTRGAFGSRHVMPILLIDALDAHDAVARLH